MRTMIEFNDRLGSWAAVACSLTGRPDFARKQAIAAALQFGGPGQGLPS